MKGLLYKDAYMLAKYNRTFAILILVFLAVPMFAENMMFYLVYPAVLVGILPVNTISYDEKERWFEYVATMPISKTQIVVSKYILGAIAIAVTSVLIAISQSVSMIRTTGLNADELGLSICLVLFAGSLSPSILMPFIFKFGVEKGRVAYYIVIAFFVAAFVGVSVSDEFLPIFQRAIGSNVGLLMIAAAVIIYVLSMLLSIKLFKSRK